MSKKLSKYRIKERLVRGFVIASGIPAVVAVIVLIVLIVVARIYANSLRDYGFAQGDVGKTMTYFSETRSALRGCIGYDDADAIQSMRDVHEENVKKFNESFADLKSSMVSAANKKIYNDVAVQLDDYWALESEILDFGSTCR